MRSCTSRTLHVSRAIAIPGYAAQVSVRAGSVIAHLASLNRDGPNRPLTDKPGCCSAARHCGLSPQPQNQLMGEFTHWGTKETMSFIARAAVLDAFILLYCHFV